jgi:hypothetical protein
MPSMLLLDIIYAQEGVWVLMNIGDCIVCFALKKTRTGIIFVLRENLIGDHLQNYYTYSKFWQIKHFQNGGLI